MLAHRSAGTATAASPGACSTAGGTVTVGSVFGVPAGGAERADSASTRVLAAQPRAATVASDAAVIFTTAAVLPARVLTPHPHSVDPAQG